MLQRSIDHYSARLVPNGDRRESPPRDRETDALLGIVRTIRRNAKMIAVITLVGTCVGTAVIFSVTPKYLATVTILVDPRQTKVLEDAQVVGRPGTDNGAIESEVELLQSEKVTRQVVNKLHLVDDEEFNGSGGLLSLVKSTLLLPIRAIFGHDDSGDPVTAVANRLDKETEAKRRGLTYVIELDAWSRNAEKAARIANTYAAVYLDDQLEAKSDATKRASDWLKGRTAEMKARLETSEKALETYKSENGLFDPGGENLSDRQISALNDQLVDARAKAAAAQAKYEQLKQVTPERLRSAAASPDVLQSPVVSNLRAQYADIAKQQAERESRYGAGHPMVAAGRAQLADTERQITAEIRRIVTSARTEYEMAKSRQESLEASLDDLKQKAAHFNQVAVKMHELEREAQANRDLFQAFLSRAKQTAEMNLQIPDSRVVSKATPPANPSYPKRALVIALAFFGSLGLGTALALARNAFGQGFRRSHEIEAALGLHPLASVPLVGAEFGRIRSHKRQVQLELLKPGESRDIDRSERRSDARQLAALSIKAPDSAFAESIRTLYYGLRRQAAGRKIGVVLVTSSLPHEGKSTVVVNLARVAANAGDNVLLIDADLRKPAIASALNIDADRSLVDVLTGVSDLSTSVKRDPSSGLYAIAGANQASGADAIGLLTSEPMSRLIGRSREVFDLVVIDSSPLSIADPHVLVEHADSVVLVVASERTSRDAVQTMLSESPELESKLAGVVLNGAVDDFDRYYRYARDGSSVVSAPA